MRSNKGENGKEVINFLGWGLVNGNGLGKLWCCREEDVCIIPQPWSLDFSFVLLVSRIFMVFSTKIGSKLLNFRYYSHPNLNP